MVLSIPAELNPSGFLLAIRMKTFALAVLVSVVCLAMPALAQVTFSAQASRTEVRPGEQFVIAAIIEHEEGWHVHTNDPVVPPEMEGFVPIPTVIAAAVSPGSVGSDGKPAAIIGPNQWPVPYSVEVDFLGTGKPALYQVFEGRAITYIPVVVSNSATPGTIEIVLSGGYQACDEKVCLRPSKINQVFQFKVVAADAAIAPAKQDPGTFGGFDNAIFAKLLAGTAAAASPDDLKFVFFGWSFEVGSTGSANTLIILLLAILGGFLLNLTPCVLPVIPLKIMSLSAAASGNPRRALLLGAVMSAGVIAFFMAIGLAIASLASFKAINQLFQHPEFSLGVGVFIAIMGIGMVGLFSIKLPNAVYMLDPKRESIVGSFFFGVLTAILSTPCTAPFMGSAAAWASKQPPGLTVLTFAAIGLGMAIPYLVLAAFPGLLRKIPRTGSASELVKQVMGLLLFAVAVFFIGSGLDGILREPVDPAIRGHWWVIAAIATGAALWTIYRTFKITKKVVARGIVVGLAIAMSASMIQLARTFTAKGPVEWVYYTPERFEEAKARGDVVVVDFTAEWCLNCKALETAVLFRERVFTVLNSEGVTPIKVDLTSDNAAGQAKLDSLDWVGIPLLAVYGPGLETPIKLDTYTIDSVLDAINKAKKK